MMDDKPPSPENQCNNPEFASTTRKSFRGLLDWCPKTLVVAGGAGVCPVRHFVFIPILDFDGKH